jgi:hypothetical protein
LGGGLEDHVHLHWIGVSTVSQNSCQNG